MNIQKEVLEETLYYQGIPVLSYHIEYPVLKPETSTAAIDQINAYYLDIAQKLVRYAKETLYRMQVDQYQVSKQYNDPLRKGELMLTYHVAYDKSCWISFFFDQYEYMGGAHGSTERSSQTWNLDTGKQMKLEDVYRYTKYYKEETIEIIKKQIEDQMERGFDRYYSDCLRDVSSMFKEDRFYLTSKGVIVYFQQYEIAPYASGIPEFQLDYSDAILIPPC